MDPKFPKDSIEMKKLEKQLREKFKCAQIAEQKRQPKLLQSKNLQDIDQDEAEEPITTSHLQIKSYLAKPKLNDAQRASDKKQTLVNKFKSARTYEKFHDETKEKLYAPITGALEKVELAVEKVNQGVEKTDEDIKKLNRKPLMMLPLPPSTQSEVVSTPTVDGGISPSVKNTIILGSVAKEFLPRANDPKFGIWYDKENKTYKIGKMEIQFNRDDIVIGDKTFKGTKGLWRLLTYTNAPDVNSYTPNDLEQYKAILYLTNAVYHYNDMNSNKPKSSGGQKYIALIKNIYTQFKQGEVPSHVGGQISDAQRASLSFGPGQRLTAGQGAGILKYNDKNIEYKYITNLSELMKRLEYLYAQEQAGNNNFHNEKLGIIDFIKNSLDNVVDSPKSLEYLIRIVPSLPKGSLKEGSGLFNDLINNLPFEIHAPGYNFLGPGTKLDKRLKRGDVPINKLDSAAKDHDIFYKNQKSTEARHEADYVLENRAWERVLADDSDVNEKSWAWLTTNAMKAKRYFGMGLKF